ncbi:hypothetical protein H9L13_12110 [Sphingomonas lutea]|uniref:ABC-type uncharacterized transport system domain-containing protein n=1 Tax=Sphingomonas lutea TaxID=1045317 RepID=A0A7G9SHK6_9SPHN|nr:Gldg family protein [Sphingomonas lutea]QNN67331.1 hypothetical protein H9L13_12110 [Sphingomonas lutea]
MTGTRARVLAALALLLLVAGAWALASKQRPAPQAAEKPVLLLLTSLPIVFGEQFALDGGGSRVLQALETRYRVRPISVTSTAELSGHNLLLLAHPPAQTSENLVALDGWVRRGGRVLLLADPALEWPSERALGDPLRPPPMFSDTGLLARWGVRLDTPETAGPQVRTLAGREVMTASPGTLHGRCAISAGRLLADCAVGKGRALIVADADFIGVEHLAGATGRNLDSLLALLDRLSRA